MSYIKKIKIKSILINTGFLLAGLILVAILLELALRLFNTDSLFLAGTDLKWIKRYSERYVVDPDFGFRPILGGDKYNKYGTKINTYNLEKRDGVTRLLFMGDSVTQNEAIINGLRHFYGEEKYEYWNAGVGSFNTVQEVAYYKKYNYIIKPDHVILTFHINDFETTPVAFFDKNNRLIVYAPAIQKRYINSFLFKKSYLYRFLLSIIINAISSPGEALYSITIDTIGEEVKANLAELKDLLGRDKIKLTVVIHPILEEYKSWSYYTKKAHVKIKVILDDLNIRAFDLTEVLDTAIKDNIDMRAGDKWHPSDAMGLYFAEYLYNKDLLPRLPKGD